MTKVLIIGAGSIGNHLCQAARAMDWSVTVCDIDPRALARMSRDIYPTRYGAWDSEIKLVGPSGVSSDDKFDIICIGTPPDSHMKIALEAIQRSPRVLHIEKPLFTPLDDLVPFCQKLHVAEDVMVTVGYDHAVAPSVTRALQYVTDGSLGKVQAIQSRTLEHWKGIFGAHPWLAGPHDSYLGFWRRGGGALSEHSHALHLGFIVAKAAGWDKLQLNQVAQSMVEGDKDENYDQLSSLQFSPSNGSGVLSVTQDVITYPTEKSFRVIGSEATLDVSLSGALDIVTIHRGGVDPTVEKFEKTRPDDFLALMQHYNGLLKGEIVYSSSPVHIDTGLAVMEIIQEAFKKQQ